MARNATPQKPRPAKPARPTRRPSGAQSARTSWRDRLDSWLLHHRASARDAGRRLVQAPASSIMTILVIAIALALPTGLSLLLDNARNLTRDWDGNAHLSVFLNTDTSAEAQRALAERWQKKISIDSTRLISAEEALAEYKALSGFGDALDALPENPLPPVIVVFPDDTSADALSALSEELAKAPEVDLVQLDVEWVQRLHALIALGARIISALAAALALAVVLVVVNTIRLAIESRREEIVVIKIVGGTDGFVRRPFLYTGFWFGLAGGIAAVVLVQLALWWIATPLDHLLGLYESSFRLGGLNAEALLTLPLFAGLLGLMGAWLAVARHLRDIEPQAF